MKYTQILVCLMAVLTICSCKDKDDELGNLPGTWKFGSAFVDGIGTTASGTITFEASLNGAMDIWVLVENDTIFKQGTFTYFETSEAVDVNFANSNLILRRSDNQIDAQEFEFFETVNNVEYGIILDLIPE